MLNVLAPPLQRAFDPVTLGAEYVIALEWASLQSQNNLHVFEGDAGACIAASQ